MKYYLAIDFGASSACCILGHIEKNKLCTEEIHRFNTGFITKNGTKIWEVDRFYENIIYALKQCAIIGRIPEFVAIDTWGVDFVLLDEKDEPVMEAVSYRDIRTEGMPPLVAQYISDEELYDKTGIQKQKFNTIYQLMAVKQQNPEAFLKAKCMMMLPDYFNFMLTGCKRQEYTNATTTGLINARDKEWDWEIIDRLGFPKGIFQPISVPGQVIGTIKESIAAQIGYSAKVVMAASHDTASAIMAVPSLQKEILYISSGTWSLLGTENTEPVLCGESRKYNFTNEGGFEYRYRFLKNIMGLWMIQSIKHELADELDFPEIASLAEASTIDTIINVNDERFLAPDSMKQAIDEYCIEYRLREPETIGDYAKIIYESLGECYRLAIEEIERLSNKHYDKINIIGGGSNASYLNEITAKRTGREVISGPSEGTAYGNILSMLKADSVIDNLEEGRSLVARSVELKTFEFI